MHRGLGGLHRIVAVVDRRRRAGQVPDLVGFDVQRERHVMADEFEPGVVVQVIDVALGPGEQVVHANDLVALAEQAVDQVRSEEPGATCHQHALANCVISHSVSRSAGAMLDRGQSLGESSPARMAGRRWMLRAPAMPLEARHYGSQCPLSTLIGWGRGRNRWAKAARRARAPAGCRRPACAGGNQPANGSGVPKQKPARHAASGLHRRCA